MTETPVLDALNRAVSEASHLGVMDGPAVEAARALALKIDVSDEYMRALAADAADRNLRPPSMDNVSIPTFLKYCDALGLTPAGRARASVEGDVSGGEDSKSKVKVGKFRTVAGGKSA